MLNLSGEDPFFSRTCKAQSARLYFFPTFVDSGRGDKPRPGSCPRRYCVVRSAAAGASVLKMADIAHW